MKCPECDAPCEADTVDIGVGEQQCSPYACTNFACGWTQPFFDYFIHDDVEELF